MNKTTTIQAAQLKHLISVSRGSLVAAIVVALILAYVQRDVIAPGVLAIWCGASLSMSLLRALLILAYGRRAPDSEETVRAWLLKFRILVLASGTVFGAAGLLLFPAGHPQHVLFLVFALAGVTAGGVVSFSADLVSAIGFSVLTLVPLVGRLLSAGDSLSVPMGAAGTVYLGFMVLSLWHINKNTVENIALRIDAADREQDLRAKEERYRLLLSHLPVGIFHYDTAHVITYCNDLLAEIVWSATDRLVGLDLKLLKDQTVLPALSRALEGELGYYEGRYRATHSAADKWISLTCAPYSDGTGRIAGGIAIVQDVTERKMAEETIRNLAFFDPLTNLPNRRLLLDRLQHAMASSARSGREVALLFIDLDNFKTLNDTLGHDMGDKLLQQVATRLTSSVREGDSVARLGGDEFVVMLEDLSMHAVEAAEQTEVIGEKLLKTLGQPYRLGAHEYRTTPSIGAILFKGHQQSGEQLLKQADIAMYQAKRAGRNALRFFDPEMQAAVAARAVLESDLRKAIDAQQFQLHFQIQMDASGNPAGAEALIRWAHPERGLVTPDEFMHVAEETDLIYPLGTWAIEAVCTQLRAWQSDAATRRLALAINVNPHQFRQRDFAMRVQGAIARHGIDPSLLILEVAERALLENVDHAISTMAALRTTGVRFVLDDFGTGYASLLNLKRLPLDHLKIDESFVRDIAADRNGDAIVRAIIAMAESLGMGVIAQGVETHAQHRFLLEHRCVRCQGPLFGRPVPLGDLEERLHGK